MKIVMDYERARDFIIQRQAASTARCVSESESEGEVGGDVAALIDRHPLHTPVMMCIEGTFSTSAHQLVLSATQCPVHTTASALALPLLCLLTNVLSPHSPLLSSFV